MDIRVPDDVPLVDIMTALNRIKLRARSRHPLSFTWQPGFKPKSVTCAHDGCKRPGVVCWADGNGPDSPHWCSDHAWDHRPDRSQP